LYAGFRHALHTSSIIAEVIVQVKELKACITLVLYGIFLKNTMNLEYVIYDPFATGSNTVMKTEKKPDDVSIQGHIWTYPSPHNPGVRESYKIGKGLRWRESDVRSGVMMVIIKDNNHHYEILERNLKEMGLIEVI
jgi:hypothetical protein